MKAVIALGANLEDPETAVELAISLLELSTDLISRSKLYLTKPVGGRPQPDYINAIAIIESELPAHDLLDLLHGIEKSMGRVRDERWGPRVIDLDLITYGDLESEDESLILPHPRGWKSIQMRICPITVTFGLFWRSYLLPSSLLV